jgi:hypothetical protein
LIEHGEELNMAKASFLLLVLLALILPLLAQETEQVRETIREILADRRYQKEIVSVREGRDAPEKSWPYSKSYKYRIRGSNSSGGGSYSGALTFLLYFLAALCLAVCVAFAVARIVNRPLRKDASGKKAGVLQAVAANVPQQEQSYQELFAAGKIVDACRKVLHDGLQQLREKKLLPAGPSFTNRELVSKLGKQQELQQPLQEIASVVEKGYYAQLPVTEKDYEACLHNLEIIRQARQ